MYPSNNNCINLDSILCSIDDDHEIIPQTHFSDNDINSISREGHNSFSSSFFDFPNNSPNMHYEYELAVSRQFHDLFHDHKYSLSTDENAVVPDPEINYNNMAYSSNNNVVDFDHVNSKLTEQQQQQQCSRIIKRSSKKDRHSKINTAHGPRDRRMRLSLDVARKFFGLQDILGFDKASKTVDWLLKNSRSAIRELMQGPCIYKQSCSASSTSECEVVSGGGMDNQSAIYENKSTVDVSKDDELEKPSSTKEEEKKNNKKKKSKVARTTVAKESRTKARERARARTNEKRILRESEPKTVNNHGPIRLMTRPLETAAEESATRISSNMNPSYEMLAEVEELSSHGHGPPQILGARDEDNWNSSTIFNYQHGAANSGHEPQFTDFQFCTKPWEAF